MLCLLIIQIGPVEQVTHREVEEVTTHQKENNHDNGGACYTLQRLYCLQE